MKKLFFISFLIILTSLTPLSVLAKSKYTKTFIQYFSVCQNYSETRYNRVYNSYDTYEIKGYAPDGSGACIYVETNEWLRGKQVTTCYFSPKEKEEYFKAMLNPDIKTSVFIRGMAYVNANEKAVYLKYFNNPKVCNTQKVQ